MNQAGGGVPANFTVGEYSFRQVTGTGDVVNGTSYLGFTMFTTITDSGQHS